MKLLRIAYKVFLLILSKISDFFSWTITFIKFTLNGVEFNNDFSTHGIPVVKVSLKGHLSIGRQFDINSGKYFNMIGRQNACYFIVNKDAQLRIGNNVGISCSAFVCFNSITIGDHVRVGGNTVIYDNDFHSLNALKRTHLPEEDLGDIHSAPVVIEDYAFIGAHSTILKGVTIGTNSIIGACSVVTHSVPPNQIWAGNPAKFVKEIAPVGNF